MGKITLVHDKQGQTLTVWFDDPERECICQEVEDEFILMKDDGGQIIGFELLHYRPSPSSAGLTVETVVQG